MIYTIRRELEHGVKLLVEAEDALKAGSLDAARLSKFEPLSASTDAMLILRSQPAFRERFVNVFKGMEDYKARHPVREGLITSASYNGLEWELIAPREKGKPDKLLYTFDKYQERLAKEGLRGPLPSEVFGLLVDNLEGKLKGDLKAVADDMLSSYGEWLSMVFERKGDLLIAYLHPEEIVRDGSKYVKQAGFTYSGETRFNIAGKKSNEWIPLQEFGNDFSLFVYSRKFADLPQVMRKGNSSAYVILPTDGTAWPVGRYGFNFRFVIYCYCSYRASRGVRRS